MWIADSDSVHPRALGEHGSLELREPGKSPDRPSPLSQGEGMARSNYLASFSIKMNCFIAVERTLFFL